MFILCSLSVLGPPQTVLLKPKCLKSFEQLTSFCCSVGDQQVVSTIRRSQNCCMFNPWPCEHLVIIPSLETTQVVNKNVYNFPTSRYEQVLINQHEATRFLSWSMNTCAVVKHRWLETPVLREVLGGILTSKSSLQCTRMCNSLNRSQTLSWTLPHEILVSARFFCVQYMPCLRH